MKKRTASRRRRSRAKRGARKSTTSSDAKRPGAAEIVTKPIPSLLELVRQLEMQTLDADSETRRHAFEVLTQTFRELFAWLHTMAALHPMLLGTLLRRFQEHEARAKYDGGEHVGAWAGVELARVYRQILADLRSRSRYAVNRFRAIRYGFDLGKFVVPPN